jgi:hypothetical protein
MGKCVHSVYLSLRAGLRYQIGFVLFFELILQLLPKNNRRNKHTIHHMSNVQYDVVYMLSIAKT